MMNVTRAVMHLIIANVLFFILATFVPEVQDKAALYYFENPEFHWWQLFSHLFMHGSIPHLFFNMFALYSFGAPLEHYFGSNIAHFAHVGGALIGFVLMKLWQKRSFGNRQLY